MIDGSAIIVVPSMTLDADELAKVPGSVHFEQRLLFLLAQLRRPDARVVYVLSQPVEPAILSYTLGLIPGLPADHAARLTFLTCHDPSEAPLTGKVLARPALVAAIRDLVRDDPSACLVTYNSTALEQELADLLGVPMYACDPRLAHLGGKSAGRRLLRDAGVPIPDGFEDLRTPDEVVRGLAALRRADPALTAAMVKLNHSFAGVGNAVFSYTGAPETGLDAWVAAEIGDRLSFNDAGQSWVEYRRALGAMGGVVEAFVEPEGYVSPSVQLEIGWDGAVQVVSTHDQILSGRHGQSFAGARFPADPPYREQLARHARRAGKLLAQQGVIGHLGIDFVAGSREPDGDPCALEINLRMGGTTAPFRFADAVVGGRFDATGQYRFPDGTPCHYVASDRVKRPDLRGRSAASLIEHAARRRMLFDPVRGTGLILFALASLPEWGRFGVIAVGPSRAAAQATYDEFLASLDEPADAEDE